VGTRSARSALHLDLFEQPAGEWFFSGLLVVFPVRPIRRMLFEKVSDTLGANVLIACARFHVLAVAIPGCWPGE